MLSEKVLEELVRRTALSEHLVTAAWPDLSTESRLQVMQAVTEANMDSCPAWLSQLALVDGAEIVRYFGARYTSFSTPEDLKRANEGGLFFGHKPTPEDIELYERTSRDASELVRAGLNEGNQFNFKTLTKTPQMHRLLFIRSLTLPTLEPFMEWLSEAIDAGVPDAELGECTQEFMALPRIKRELARDRMDFSDGWDAYSAGKGVELAWQVVKKAGPVVQNYLVYELPTSMGLHTCSVEELASMPERVLSSFPYRSDESKEIAAVVRLIRDHPERFPKEVVESLSRADEYGGGISAEARAKARAQAAVDRSEVMLDAVMSLKDQLTSLAERVGELQEAASRKRGFFS